MVLIVLLGKKRSGKDTIANYCSDKYEYQKISLADPLKIICKNLFGFTEEQLYGNLKEEIDPKWNQSPRNIYQYLGTDIFREDIQKILPGIKNNFWIQTLIDRHDIKNNEKKFIIADCRFQNEVDEFIKYGAIIIKVEKCGTIVDAHTSESGIDNIINYHYRIENNSSKSDLYKKIDNILEKSSFQISN